MRERERLEKILYQHECDLFSEKKILDEQLTKIRGIKLKILRVKNKIYDLEQFKLFK